MEIRRHVPDLADLLRLYGSVGWTAYTDDPDRLCRAWQGSLLTLSAWVEKILVGALRAVGDGETILFIQDVLVVPERQRRGIGTMLMREALAVYPHVRQTQLLTDNAPETLAFYRSLGFMPAEEAGCRALLRLNQ
ncbi:MAG: GNAT family N-acetyltransferase [Christensenellaceae bacterium]|nr:GNAT family N-acetyltransferase [Christensenellaceae bacterium]